MKKKMEWEDVLLGYYRCYFQDSWYQEDGCDRDTAVEISRVSELRTGLRSHHSPEAAAEHWVENKRVQVQTLFPSAKPKPMSRAEQCIVMATSTAISQSERSA